MAVSDSRDRMLEAAIELMRGSGISGAGINEIVRASGSPKGSVYHFFPNGKAQIASEALGAYSARVRAFIDEALSSQREPAAKVTALFGAFARRVEQGRFHRSCAVGAVSLDLDEEWEGLRGVLDGAFTDWVACVAAHFDFGSPTRTHAFASLVVTTIEGAYVRARAAHSSAPFTEAGAWLALLPSTPTATSRRPRRPPGRS